MKRILLSLVLACSASFAMAQPSPTVSSMKKLVSLAPPGTPVPVLLGLVAGVYSAIGSAHAIYDIPICPPPRTGGEVYEMVLRHLRAEDDPKLLDWKIGTYVFMVMRDEFPCPGAK